MAVVLSCALLLTIFPAPPVSASVKENATIAGSSVNVREKASPSSNRVSVIYSGHRVEVIELVKGDRVSQYDDDRWYRIEFVDLEGEQKEGFVLRPFIMLDATGSADKEFEDMIKDFPTSYHPYLLALHEQYPNWIFIPQHTGLDWDKVIAEESKVGRSLISNSFDDAWKSTHTVNDPTEQGWESNVRDAYNWRTDTYIAYDGAAWVNASPDIIAYYMDPRSFLNQTQIFQFLELSYDASNHNIETVEQMLQGTFMASDTLKNSSGKTISYAQAFMDAAQTHKVNPYFLVARVRQEVVVSGGKRSGSVTGTYSGYKGYYNFYNIGATSSTDPIANALRYASGTSSYGRPWNSEYKAILGGAQWIENGYIGRGQDTLYLQKWHVIGEGDLFWRQYMTNVMAATSEAIRLCNAYSDMTDYPLVFKIPVYNNMPYHDNIPDEGIRPPARVGNPNNWLLDISVDDYRLTPSFDPNILEYQMIVDYNTTSVTINTKRASSLSRVTGAGEKDLSVGPNSFELLVRAQDGSRRTYKVMVVRLGENEGSPPFSSPYSVDGQYISGFKEGTKRSEFLAELSLDDGYSVQIYDATGARVTDNNRVMRTGDVLMLENAEGEVTHNYSLVLYGDVIGNGRIGASDLTSTIRHILKQTQLSGPSMIAADVNRDGRVGASDLTMMERHVLREIVIKQ